MAWLRKNKQIYAMYEVDIQRWATGDSTLNDAMRYNGFFASAFM